MSGQVVTPQQVATLDNYVDKAVDNGKRANAFGALVAKRFVEGVLTPHLKDAAEKFKVTATEIAKKAAEDAVDGAMDVIVAGCKSLVTAHHDGVLKPYIAETDKRMQLFGAEVQEMGTTVKSLGTNMQTLNGNMQTLGGDVRTLNDNQTALVQKQNALEQEVLTLKGVVQSLLGGAGAGPPPSAPGHQVILPTPGAIKAARTHGFPDDLAHLFMDATGTRVIPVKDQQKRADDIRANAYP